MYQVRITLPGIIMEMDNHLFVFGNVQGAMPSTFMMIPGRISDRIFIRP